MNLTSILIDESGDLGTNFHNKATKPFFIIGVLVCRSPESYKHIVKSTERTIKNKLFAKRKIKKTNFEIKGWKTDLSIKEYFYRQCAKRDHWELYFNILDKTQYVDSLSSSKDKVYLYNLLAKEIIDIIDFNDTKQVINLYIDKHKSTSEEKNFNEYIESNLSAKLPSNSRINYYHVDSKANKGIQAIDLFCSGVYDKYNNKSDGWYKIFEKKIKRETTKKRCTLTA